MADLPRYRPLGAAIASMPSVNYVQTANIQAQKFQEIDRSLGRISDYLYEQEVARAQVAGAKYGAEKAPTIEQLSEARESGRDISGLVPGDDTVFGMAARKSAMSVIESQMEISARGAIAQLRIDAEANEMSADEFQVKLNGLLDGYSTTLSQISPISANNFEASMAVVANSNLLAHAQDIAKKNEEREKFAAEYTVTEYIIPKIPELYGNGVSVSEDGKSFVTPDDRLDQERKSVVDYASSVNNPDLIVQFDKARAAGRNAYLAEWASENKIARYNELKNGTASDPNIIAMWDRMTDEERLSSLDALRKAEEAELSLTSARRRQEEALAKEESDNLVGDIYDLVRGGSFEEAQPLIDRLSDLDPDRAEKFNNILYIEGGIDRASVVQDLDIKSLQNTLTIDDLMNAPAGSLSTKTFRRFLGEIKANKDERHQNAVSLLSNHFGNPEKLAFGRTGKDVKKLKTLNEYKNEMINRRLEEGFDPIAYANEKIAQDIAAEENTVEYDMPAIRQKSQALGLVTPDGKRPQTVEEIRDALVLFSRDNPEMGAATSDAVTELFSLIGGAE